MSRWKVERENSWDGPCWFVFDPDGRYITNRFDWAEALAYADRKARTREVVLPRIAPVGELTVSAIWSYDSPVVHYIDASGRTVQGTPADLRPLACALLALAEQEEHQ